MRYRVRYTLKQWRRLRGITLQGLADTVGVDYTTVWRWENGVVQPNAKYIPLLEKALNIKWSDDLLMPQE